MTTTHEHQHHHLSGKSPEGSVVLDIGGDIGAAVIFTPATFIDHEIEIRHTDSVWDGTHTAVRERQMGAEIRYAGVFGALPAGSYQIRLRDHPGATEHHIEVSGGQVCQWTWPLTD